MKLLPFEGFIIPGLHFQDCCIWILNWAKAPTPFNKMTEVWVLGYQGEKVCYINPGEAEMVFKKYHDFDKIIHADINILETASGIDIRICIDKKDMLILNLKIKKSFKYKVLNFIIKHGNKEKIGEKGMTETGMSYHNLPNKINPILIDKAELEGIKLITIDNPKVRFSLGDGMPSDKPIVNYCTHMLEE
jgi:hypothetical protein